MTIGVVIAAAGAGARLMAAGPKAFLTLAGETLLARCLRTFLAHPGVTAIVAVVPDPAAPEARGLDSTRVRVVRGGPERQDSVRAGLAVLPEVDVVLVHDAARPFASPDLVDAVAAAAFRHGAAVPVLPLSDTLKQVDAEGRVGGTMPREGLFMAQTPQGFRGDLLCRAHEAAAREGIRATDDAALVERMGVAVQVVAGDPLNIKITTPGDLLLAEAIRVVREVRRA